VRRREGSGTQPDFVLAGAETTDPRLAVELDDKSRWPADTEGRDQFKGRAPRAGGLPAPRVTAAGKYGDVHLKVRASGALAG
jgi:hypothetical protein